MREHAVKSNTTETLMNLQAIIFQVLYSSSVVAAVIANF